MKPRSTFVRAAARWFIWSVSHTAARIIVRGRHYIPESPPFIAIGNHFGNFEPPLMILALPFPIDFLAAGDTPFEAHVAWGPWVYGYIPTMRLTSSPSSLRSALRALRNNRVVGMFPEGRADRNVVRPPKPGAAYLAYASGVPVIPVGFSGLDRIFYQISNGIRAKVYIVIGPPIIIPGKDLNAHNRREIVDRFGGIMMKHVAALVDPDHRGDYSDDPQVKHWDNRWGWRSHFGDLRIPSELIDTNKMSCEEVDVEAIGHRNFREVLAALRSGKGDL